MLPAVVSHSYFLNKSIGSLTCVDPKSGLQSDNNKPKAPDMTSMGSSIQTGKYQLPFEKFYIEFMYAAAKFDTAVSLLPELINAIVWTLCC